MRERYFPIAIVISGLIIGALILFTGPSLELLGIDRIQLTEFFPGSHKRLSEML
mgnify:CR=1 FL=1